MLDVLAITIPFTSTLIIPELVLLYIHKKERTSDVKDDVPFGDDEELDFAVDIRRMV